MSNDDPKGANPCPTCDGQGGWKEAVEGPDQGEFMAVECPKCHGSGMAVDMTDLDLEEIKVRITTITTDYPSFVDGDQENLVQEFYHDGWDMVVAEALAYGPSDRVALVKEVERLRKDLQEVRALITKSGHTDVMRQLVRERDEGLIHLFPGRN